jgi:hypothetical protein
MGLGTQILLAALDFMRLTRIGGSLAYYLQDRMVETLKHAFSMMVLVEKLQRSLSQGMAHDYRSSIGFVISPATGCAQDEIYLELYAVEPRQAMVSLTDQTGNLLLREEQTFLPDQERLVYRIQNLAAGTYYFEVSDGFYYQVKEVQIQAA